MKQTTKKTIYRIITFIIAIFMVIMALGSLITSCASQRASAATLNDQLSSAQKMQSQIEDQIRAESNESNQIQKKIDDLQSKIAVVNNDIATLEDQIQEKVVQIAESEAIINKKFNAYKGIVRAAYEDGQAVDDNIIFQSKDMIDFTYNSVLVNKLLDFEKEIIETLKAEKAKLEQAKACIIQDKAQVQTKKNMLASSKLDLDAQKEKQKVVIADLRKKDAEIERQMAKLVAQLSAQTSRGSGTYSGSILWPVPGYYMITSPFGHRKSPGGIGSTNHQGIDISGYGIYGRTVVAAAAGRVVKAGWGSGYGNMVMIDHGNGFSTLYGHGSAVLCSEGETVAKGQAILRVGSTGNSTGPHLHFGTYRNGSAVNPMIYFNKK